MWDPVSTDRFSAYLDGELSDDERKLVEQELAESEEHRQLLKELESVQTDLKALPSYAAPPDLQARIAAQIEASKVTPASLPAAGGSSSGLAWKWAAAVSLLAAVVVVFLMTRRPADAPESESITEVSPSVPGPMQVRPVPVHLKELPQWTMVYEITLTDAGYDDEVFEKILEQFKIGLDPTMKVSREIEEDLMAFRGGQVAGELEPLKPPTDEGQDKEGQEGARDKGEDGARDAQPEGAAIEDGAQNDDLKVIYISGTLYKIDQVGRQLYKLLNSPEHAGQQVAELRTEFVLEPRQLAVMRQLHESAQDHFANNPTIGPSEEAYAFQVTFRVRFTGLGVPGAGSFAMPAVRAVRKPKPPVAAANGKSDTKLVETQLAADDEPEHGPEVDVTTTGQVLVIVRRQPPPLELPVLEDPLELPLFRQPAQDRAQAE